MYGKYQFEKVCVWIPRLLNSDLGIGCSLASLLAVCFVSFPKKTPKTANNIRGRRHVDEIEKETEKEIS